MNDLYPRETGDFYFLFFKHIYGSYACMGMNYKLMAKIYNLNTYMFYKKST